VSLVSLRGGWNHTMEIQTDTLPHYWVVVQFEIHRAGNRLRPVGNCRHGKG
jgi:hypothetical protein